MSGKPCRDPSGIRWIADAGSDQVSSSNTRPTRPIRIVGEHETILEFVFSSYILPAVHRGDDRITIVVANLCRELGAAHGMVAIHAVLSSAELRKTLDLKRSDDYSFDPFSPMQLPKEYVFGLIPFRKRVASARYSARSSAKYPTPPTQH